MFFVSQDISEVFSVIHLNEKFPLQVTGLCVEIEVIKFLIVCIERKIHQSIV